VPCNFATYRKKTPRKQRTGASTGHVILTCPMRHEPLGQPLRVHLVSAYGRFERPISSISLLGGFVFDAVTLKRVDTFWDNFWIVVHLVVVAVCILAINRVENITAEAADLPKSNFWLINTLQFFLGGLLSTFLVFYFRSGSLWVSWPFFVVLGAAFVANEKLKRHYSRLYFQLSLFFLCLYCFTIFIVPVVLHAMGPMTFLCSGAVSLTLLFLFVGLLRSVTGENLGDHRKMLVITIGTIFLAINIFYFLHVIPPLPLSLQSASVYHAITRNAIGNYSVQSEYRGPFSFFRFHETFHTTAASPVYAYSAIFSPTSLNTKIVHEWQRYELKRGWVKTDRIELSVLGGRDGGYRTYSVKAGIAPGAWRVNIETPNGALLGRLRFDVIVQSSDPPLVTQLKN
jgi:hypothetical protein